MILNYLCFSILIFMFIGLIYFWLKYPGYISSMWRRGKEIGKKSNTRVVQAKANGLDGLSLIFYRIRNVLSDLAVLLGFRNG